MHEYAIEATWDDEAGVWVAESQDVPGLVTEAASLDELAARLVIIIPELLELNSHIHSPQAPGFAIHAKKNQERFTLIRIAA